MAAVAQRAGVVTLAAHATAPPASCPHCGISSRRIQSPYARRPRSFAGGGWRALGLARPPLAWPACQPHDSAVRRTRTGGVRPTALDPWLTDGLASEMPERVSFATGVQRERPAGPQALVLPCSHGQGAGQSTQVTLLKRPSDGRAKRDRLRQRMRHAA